MSYNSITRPKSTSEQTRVAKALLARGWFEAPEGMPVRGLGDLARQAPQLAFNNDGSVAYAEVHNVCWAEMWCICLWRQSYDHHGVGAYDFYALAERYKQSPRRRQAILVSSLVSTSWTVGAKAAIAAALKRLDVEYGDELQRIPSPERVEDADRGESSPKG